MRIALGCLLGFALLCSTGCSAADHDFDTVVTGVEQQYSTHAERVPLMGLISLCARAKTHGGVRSMRIAEFDHIEKLDADGLSSMMQSELGPEWQPMVKERSAARSEMSVIFVSPSQDSNHSMRMMIADYDNHELDLVRMEMNGSALAHWMQNPQSHEGMFRHGKSSAAQTD